MGCTTQSKENNKPINTNRSKHNNNPRIIVKIKNKIITIILTFIRCSQIKIHPLKNMREKSKNLIHPRPSAQ